MSYVDGINFAHRPIVAHLLFTVWKNKQTSSGSIEFNLEVEVSC